MCAGCRPRLASITCENCKGPCNKTVKIDTKAPKEVLKLFEDPTSQLKTVLKIVDFQKRQRRRLLAHYRHNYAKEHKKLHEMTNRKDDLMERLRSMDLHREDLDRKVVEAEARNRRLKEALVQQQQQLFQETSKPNPFHGNPQERLSSSFNGFEAIGDPAMMSTPFKPMARCHSITSQGTVSYTHLTLPTICSV